MPNKVWLPSQKWLKKQQEYAKKELRAIGETKLKELIKAAARVSGHAYQPYSRYSVGAAVLCRGGELFSSCNSEVATFGLCDCGEFSAITKAVGEGMVKKYGRKFLRVVVIATKDKGMPCGRCRQKMLEHSDNCLVVTVNLQGKIGKITTAQMLLPDAFGPGSLGID